MADQQKESRMVYRTVPFSITLNNP